MISLGESSESSFICSALSHIGNPIRVFSCIHATYGCYQYQYKYQYKYKYHPTYSRRREEL